jgi:hypothetical protein
MFIQKPCYHTIPLARPVELAQWYKNRTHYPKFEGLNTATTGPERTKIDKNVISTHTFLPEKKDELAVPIV